MICPPDFVWRDAVALALAEDLGRRGDLTSRVILKKGQRGAAKFVARQAGRLSGLSAIQATFAACDLTHVLELHKSDGDAVAPGDLIAMVEGDAAAILEAERTALNFLSHLSGVATATAKFVDAVKHTKAKICDTRKTTPGLRALEKYAVACGGGVNHRFGLDDAILIKDNHIAMAGGILPAIAAARAAIGHMIKIEVEVDTLDQLRAILDQKIDAVLLDNMKPDQLREAVILIASRFTTEASGGVNLETVRAIAESGVDLISVGWITHSAPILDIGLDI